MHEAQAGRRLHKPRFLTPMVDDATLAARPVKPLRWLLKLIYSIYDSKFAADAVDNRYGHPHDPFPEFIYMWTCKRYGLRDLVGATRWDLALAVEEYTSHLAEVRQGAATAWAAAGRTAGGGAGADGGTGGNGTDNLGGGGGGGSASGVFAGGNGGSGVVILRFPSTISATIDAGLTSSTATDGADTVITFTGGTGPVTLEQA